MKTAPIQLSQISFRRVSVELDGKRFPSDGSEPKNLSHDFDRVKIATGVNFSPEDEGDGEGRGTGYFLALRVAVDNQEKEEGDTRFSPYLIDIEAGAVIRALPGSEALEDIEGIVLVNGTSLLWSAIREQVSNLTARMPAGAVTLPTVNFLDLKEKKRQKDQGAGTAGKKPAARKRPSARKAAKPATS